jgi:CHAD domain-containing protein
MRVACRRLRSDLRTFSPLFEQGETQTLRTELAWLADSLGAARDVEVLRARLVKTAEADRLNPVSPAVFARLDAALAQSESDALDRVAQALGTDRYLRLLDLAVAVARAPRMTSLANEPIRDVFPPLVSRAVADLDRKVRKLTHKAPDATWHTARIRAKRARYAAEATIDVFGKKAKKTASAVAGVQTILGDHQDAAVAADALVTIARDHSDDLDLVLLCGSLAERERASIHVTRRRFRRAWKTAMSSSVRAWLPKPEPREG